MRFSGTDRDIAVAVIHILLGQKGTTLYNFKELSVATDQLTDLCLDNPN